MATPCVIRIEGNTFVELYKHWDGMPSSTLPWLEDFNAEASNALKDDTTYKFAALVRSSIRDAEKYGLDDSKFTGWGIYPPDKVAAAEYIYTLKKDGSVTWEKVV